MKFFSRLTLVLGLLVAPLSSPAQPVAALIEMGDEARARANPAAALELYESAVKLDPASHVAKRNASLAAMDLGEALTDTARQRELYSAAEAYARDAVAANPADADAHFALARALGRTALTKGGRERVRFANEVRTHALAALEIDPGHAGALHVMGLWNAEVMRLNRIERFIAMNLLGGRVFGEASWDEAVRYLEGAVAAEPNRLVHRMALGQVHADMGNKARAREQLEFVTRAPPSDYNDAAHKREAERALAAIN